VKVLILLDEDVHSVLAEALRKRGYDAIHVQELDRKGRPDAEQLHFAVLQNRCIVSFNVADFVQLHNEYVQADRHHWGIVVSQQIPIGEALRRLLVILQNHTAETMKDRLEFL